MRIVENFLEKHPLLSLYLGATIAVNTVFYGAETAIEAVERAPKKTYVATMGEPRLFSGPVSSANIHMWFADATTPDGTTHHLADKVSVLNGKLLPNGVLPGVKAGRQYALTTIDSIFGEVVLSAEPRS